MAFLPVFLSRRDLNTHFIICSTKELSLFCDLKNN